MSKQPTGAAPGTAGAAEAADPSADREWLRFVLDAIPDLIFFKDRDGRFRYCNAAVGRLIGRDPADIIGCTDADLFPAEEAAEHRAADLAIFADGQPRRRDLWKAYPDGRRILVDVIKTPCRDADDRIIGVLGVSRDVTELRRSQEMLQAAQQITGLGAWEMDLCGCRLLWSEQTHQIFGLAPGEGPKDEDAFYQLVHPEDRDAVLFDYEASLAEARPHLIDHRILRADGEVRWVRERARHIYDAAGRPQRSIGTIIDITDERRARQALADSKARYSALFETADEALWLLGEALGLSEVNPAAARLFGYDAPAQMAGLMPQAVSPPEQPDGRLSVAAWAEFEARIRARGNARMTWQHRRRDGSLFLADVGGRKVPFGDAHVMLARITDLSERRRRAELERLANAVFYSTAEGITITDPDGNIVAVNPAFTAITGYGADEVVGQNPRILQSGRQDRDFYVAMWAALADPHCGHWQGELWNRRKDGEVYPEWMSINAIRDENGQIANYVAVFSDITQAHRSAEEIERLSSLDPLTDLPNERALRSRLVQVVADAKAQGRRFGVFYVDLDHFKGLVVARGHGIGDAVLRLVGEQLAGRLRPADLLARLGDDTFVVVAETADGFATASQLAAGYQAACGEPLQPAADLRLRLTAGVGVALFPDDAVESAELLRSAASALLQAKQDGAGEIAFYRPEITAAADARLALEAALREALAADAFELHYQPVVDAGTGIIEGAEALLRWRRGDKLLAPGAFIEVAESSDLILPLGRWVIEQAIRQLAEWRRDKLAPIFVSVNVAEAQIAAGGLAETIGELLRRYHVPGSLLQVEVVERVLLKAPALAQQELEQIRALGVAIALDDFGTGYSSLGYLARFPVDTLKIDRSFVSAMVQEPGAATIVRAILSMARSLGIRSVAEGVETEVELDLLVAQRCELIQGYLASRPIPADAFGELVRELRPILPRRAQGALERGLLLFVGHDDTREALAEWIGEHGWQVFTPCRLDDACALIVRERIGVALIEDESPDGSGIEVAERLRRLFPRLVQLLAIRPGDPQRLVDAVNRGGVCKLLMKPVDLVELRLVLDQAFERARALAEG